MMEDGVQEKAALLKDYGQALVPPASIKYLPIVEGWLCGHYSNLNSSCLSMIDNALAKSVRCNS